VCFRVRKYLNSKDFKKKFPESGEDIKVMGLREDNNFTLLLLWLLLIDL